MDAGRGIICRGPEGPYPLLPSWNSGGVSVPSTVDLLQEDVFLRFLSGLKSKDVDRGVALAMMYSWVNEDASEMCDQPTVISTLTQTTIALANNVWGNPFGSFSERTLLEKGLNR